MTHTRGFTLIELLVVIVIMAVVIGSVSLTLFDSAGEKLERESRRLLAVIEYAQQQATLNNRQLALTFDQSGYRFLQLDRGQAWVPYAGERVLAQHAFAEPVWAEVYLDGIKVTLSAVDADEPQVFILSSGEMQPFTVTLMTDRHQATITGDLLGRLTLERGP